MWIVVSSVLSFFRVISNTYLCRGCSCNSDHRLQLGHFPACPSLPPHHCIQQTFVICFLWKAANAPLWDQQNYSKNTTVWLKNVSNASLVDKAK